MPLSLVAAMNETQANPSIKVNFGDNIAGSHRMVFLGCHDVPEVGGS
jgi:hypothetical protein